MLHLAQSYSGISLFFLGSPIQESGEYLLLLLLLLLLLKKKAGNTISLTFRVTETRTPFPGGMVCRANAENTLQNLASKVGLRFTPKPSNNPCSCQNGRHQSPLLVLYQIRRKKVQQRSKACVYIYPVTSGQRSRLTRARSLHSFISGFLLSSENDTSPP